MARSGDDDAIAHAFATRASDIQVAGEGTVVRVLADDMNGSQHQRFIVQLASGQTLLITHNIDIAPRINGLEEGDSVRFYGEYVWNAKGGVILGRTTIREASMSPGGLCTMARPINNRG